MKGLTIRKTIVVGLTADDWELYTCEEALKEQCELAAIRLNSALEWAVNKQEATRAEAFDAVEQVMIKWAFTGAYDTEPRFVLERLLNEIYR